MRLGIRVLSEPPTSDLRVQQRQRADNRIEASQRRVVVGVTVDEASRRELSTEETVGVECVRPGIINVSRPVRNPVSMQRLNKVVVEAGDVFAVDGAPASML